MVNKVLGLDDFFVTNTPILQLHEEHDYMVFLTTKSAEDVYYGKVKRKRKSLRALSSSSDELQTKDSDEAMIGLRHQRIQKEKEEQKREEMLLKKENDEFSFAQFVFLFQIRKKN